MMTINSLSKRRYTTLSFRNTEEGSQPGTMYEQRSKSLRHRRSLSELSEIKDTHAFYSIEDDSPQVLYNEDKDLVKIVRKKRSPRDRSRRDTLVSLDSNSLDLATSSDDSEVTRNRRDVPGCVKNVNSQRQLAVGCSDENLIEVHPKCGDDGDEGNTFIFIINFYYNFTI